MTQRVHRALQKFNSPHSLMASLCHGRGLPPPDTPDTSRREASEASRNGGDAISVRQQSEGSAGVDSRVHRYDRLFRVRVCVSLVVCVFFFGFYFYDVDSVAVSGNRS